MTIFDKIDEITVDKKQSHQFRALFKIAFITGMAFAKNLEHVHPSNANFESLYRLYLSMCETEMIDTFRREMDDFEKGKETQLG